MGTMLKYRQQQSGRHINAFLVPLFFLLASIWLGRPVVAQTPSPSGNINRGTLLAVFEPFRKAVIASEVSSRVECIHKEMGQKFEAGEPLVTLDSENFSINLKKARALLKLAEANHKSITELFEEKTVSLLELNKTQTELTVANLNLASAKLDFAACNLKSPYAGRIKKVLVNEHEWTVTGQPLLEIVDDKILLARVLTPLSFLNRIQVGNTVTIKVNIVGLDISGKISHISPVIDSASQTIEILIEVDNKKGDLKSGMTGVLFFPTLNPAGPKYLQESNEQTELYRQRAIDAEPNP